MQSPIHRVVPSGQGGQGLKLAIHINLPLRVRNSMFTLPPTPLPCTFMVHKEKPSSLPFSNNSFG